jgi:GAF domain-containing protein
MRSRTVRFTVGLLALIALGVAAAFVIRTQQESRNLSTSLRAFDLHARETAAAIAELRAGQQAYVAAGQGAAFWMPKVASTTTTVKNGILTLRQSATSGTALAALMEGEAAVSEFDAVDKRARDYLQSGDQLMAADVIFTEGGETAATAARQVERARQAELEAFDAREGVVRAQQALALGAGAGVTGLFVILLAFIPASAQAESTSPSLGLFPGPVAADKVERAAKPAPVQTQPESSARALASLMRSTAELCTDFGRIRELSDLKDLLARASKTMDASGIVVWLGSTTGADLQPIVSHGYSPAVIARMPAVPRNADNAAAAAYRTGALQIVLARPGGSPGALVAPLLTPEGCVGALSAETRNGGEGSQAVQSLAVIFAAHLAGVFATTANDAAETKVAQA